MSAYEILITKGPPRGYIPRVCFVKHVNSLLGNVFVSLLWFQDSSNPMMLWFNAHRWSEPWGKFVFLRIFLNISRAYVWTFRVHMNTYLRQVASEGINHHVEHCISVPASRVLFSSRCPTFRVSLLSSFMMLGVTCVRPFMMFECPVSTENMRRK